MIDYAAFLPSDSIPWPWVRQLIENQRPDAFATTPGYPDSWVTTRRRLEGLRLLTSGDHPETARLHRLVGACVREQLRGGTESNLLGDLVELLTEIQTPFLHEFPLDVFLNTWHSIPMNWRLRDRLMEKAVNQKKLCDTFAERWADLSYQLGDTLLEQRWLEQWQQADNPGNRLIGKRAAFLHRKGNTRDACSLLEQHLQLHGQDFELSSQLLMYLAQTGFHEATNTLALRLEDAHASVLSSDKLLRARFYHHKYFILHELEQNLEAVSVNRFIREVYSDNHLVYDSLIATVNLGDALWAIGETSEATDLLRQAYSKGRACGLTQVEDIAAICLANVLSSTGANQEASELYAVGVGLSSRMGHHWDMLYAQAYRVLNEFEVGRCTTVEFESIRESAVKAGFDYLAALVDSHICIASFIGATHREFPGLAVRRGLSSAFASCRLYALSATLREQLAAGAVPDRNWVGQWVSALQAVQGLKGRIGVIARLSEWLLEANIIELRDIPIVREWIDRYVPASLMHYYKRQYPFPETS